MVEPGRLLRRVYHELFQHLVGEQKVDVAQAEHVVDQKVGEYVAVALLYSGEVGHDEVVGVLRELLFQLGVFARVGKPAGFEVDGLRKLAADGFQDCRRGLAYLGPVEYVKRHEFLADFHYFDEDRDALVSKLVGVDHVFRELLCARPHVRGVLDAPDPQSTGPLGLRSARAKFFTEDVRKDPEILAKMGYRRADISTMTGNDPSVIPDGSILNYAGGCSFADPVSGHIELTVSRSTYVEMRQADPKGVRARAIDDDEVTVCHFSCTGRTLPFIRTYGTDGPPRRVKDAKGKLKTIPGRKACLNLYVPVKAE